MRDGTAARREIEVLSIRELWGWQFKKDDIAEGQQEGTAEGRQENRQHVARGV